MKSYIKSSFLAVLFLAVLSLGLGNVYAKEIKSTKKTFEKCRMQKNVVGFFLKRNSNSVELVTRILTFNNSNLHFYSTNAGLHCYLLIKSDSGRSLQIPICCPWKDCSSGGGPILAGGGGGIGGVASLN